MMKILKYWLMILWLALALPVAAASLPNYYPKEFSSGGIIELTDLSAGRLRIDSMEYAIASSIKVYTPTNENASILDLKRGTIVGYDFIYNEIRQRTIIRIWVLPDESLLPEKG